MTSIQPTPNDGSDDFEKAASEWMAGSARREAEWIQSHLTFHNRTFLEYVKAVTVPDVAAMYIPPNPAEASEVDSLGLSQMARFANAIFDRSLISGSKLLDNHQKFCDGECKVYGNYTVRGERAPMIEFQGTMREADRSLSRYDLLVASQVEGSDIYLQLNVSKIFKVEIAPVAQDLAMQLALDEFPRPDPVDLRRLKMAVKILGDHFPRELDGKRSIEKMSTPGSLHFNATFKNGETKQANLAAHVSAYDCAHIDLISLRSPLPLHVIRAPGGNIAKHTVTQANFGFAQRIISDLLGWTEGISARI